MTADNYVYLLDGKAYINLTNKCSNACTFCIRNTGDGVKDTTLWLSREPSAIEVLTAFSTLNYGGEEVVFCGFGEPTERLDVLKDVAAELKLRGYRTRLNTNGLGCLINGRDIVPELGDIDIVSVSLGNHNRFKYLDITHSRFGEAAFGAVVGFASDCRDAGHDVEFTVVNVISEKDVASCKRLCQVLEIPLRVREYIPNNYN